MNDRIIIFGASSMIGNHLTRLMSDVELTKITRGGSIVNETEKHKSLIYDLSDKNWVHKDNKFDVCVFCADTSLVSSLPRQLEIRHLILISSASKTLKEQSTDADDRLLVSELTDAERHVTENFPNYTIIRPTWIFDGKTDKISQKIIKLVRLTKLFPFTTNPRGKRNPIDPLTLAHVIKFFIDAKHSFGKMKVNVGGKYDYEYADIVKLILDKNNIKFMKIYLPLSLFIRMLQLLHCLNLCSSIRAFMFKHMEEDLSICNAALPEDLQELIGTKSDDFWEDFHEA